MKLHDFKKMVDILKDVREKIMLGTVDIIDVLTEINTLEAILDKTQVEEA